MAASKTLSEREKQVARYAANGLSNPEIAEILVLSVRTVESHMYRVLRKLGLSQRGELVGMRSQL
ncbi:MAG: helix-turn-helix transcriptional regulator [Microbacterium sp.]